MLDSPIYPKAMSLHGPGPTSKNRNRPRADDIATRLTRLIRCFITQRIAIASEKVSFHPLIYLSSLILSLAHSLIAFNSTKAGPGGWEDTSDLKPIAKKERYTKEEQ